MQYWSNHFICLVTILKHKQAYFYDIATKMIQVKQNKILDLKKPPISFDEISKRMDKWTLVFCLIYIILFSVIYWVVALNQIQSMINSLDE